MVLLVFKISRLVSLQLALISSPVNPVVVGPACIAFEITSGNLTLVSACCLFRQQLYLRASSILTWEMDRVLGEVQIFLWFGTFGSFVFCLHLLSISFYLCRLASSLCDPSFGADLPALSVLHGLVFSLGLALPLWRQNRFLFSFFSSCVESAQQLRYMLTASRLSSSLSGWAVTLRATDIMMASGKLILDFRWPCFVRHRHLTLAPLCWSCHSCDLIRLDLDMSRDYLS